MSTSIGADEDANMTNTQQGKDHASMATAEQPLAKKNSRAGGRRTLGRQGFTIRSSGPAVWAVGIAVIGTVIGLLISGNQAYDWSGALVNAVFALGCGIVISWGRIGAFGQALYFAAGGYTAALLVPLGLPAPAVLVAGALVAGIIAFVFSVITIRLGFTAFAMLTLVIGQAGNQLIYTIDALGGENGLFGVMRPTLFGTTDTSFYFYCLLILVILIFLARWLYQSSTGRAMRAVRDDSVRAESLGINVGRNRVMVFTIGGAVAGVAGVMYAQLQGVVDPSMGTFTQSTVGVLMVVLGGLGTFAGSIFGGVVYYFLNLLTTNLTNSPSLYLGILFILFVLLTPVAVVIGRRIRHRWERRNDTPSRSNAGKETAS